MIARFDYATIRNGATFQALVNVLLLHDDSRMIVFTKEGPDGGLDAISGDWTCAYQAKFHAYAKPSHAFVDAREELENIAKYRAPGHDRNDQWQHVATWKLITNAPFGPEDADKWNREIAPEFAKLGISTARCETVAWLDQRLAARPDVAACFFEGKTRCFNSLAEFRLRVTDAILANAFDQPLLERQAALDRVTAFIRDPTMRVLVLHGPGGVGKTRFLCEAGLRASQLGLFGAVYCATPAVETSSDWYQGIVAEVPALVIVDEPQDPKFIDVLLSELQGRAKAWKVIIAARSPNHPVLQLLKNPRLSIVSRPDLELRALPKDAAVTAAINLTNANLSLTTDDSARAAEWLVRISGGIPIWIVIGVRLLADRGDLRDLPVDRWEVATGYLREIIMRGPPNVASPEQLKILLHWIALAQPINHLDSTMIEFLKNEADFASTGDVERALLSLRQRRVLSFYGIDERLAEIRPDVMRDFIIGDWLTLPVDPDDPAGPRRPNSDATNLVQRIVATLVGKDRVPLFQQAVITLGRLEYGMELRLLDPLASWALETARQAKDAGDQLDVLEVAKVFGPFRPIVFTQIVDVLNTTDAPDGYRELE